MAETSPVLTNDAIRRQVLLEGVKEDLHEKFLPFLRQMDREIRLRLTEEGETIESKRRLRELLRDINKIQDEVYEQYLLGFDVDLDEVAITQAGLEAEALNQTVVDFETTLPAENQLIAAYRLEPLSVRGKSQGMTLEPFLKQFTTDQKALINGIISQGFAEGRTISQITRDIRGTSGNRFRDGQLAGINRNNRIMVRTAVQNASEQARQRVWDKNKDLVVGVGIVATLDSRTTTICRSLDGEEFPLNKGPRPPFHYGCRTTTTPVLSERFDFLNKGARRPAVGEKGAGQVNSETTYYSWLKTQPASFQDEVLGPTRGRLLRNGGLTSEQFAKMQLNTNYKPMTIEQMKREAKKSKDAAIRNSFENANLA